MTETFTLMADPDLHICSHILNYNIGFRNDFIAFCSLSEQIIVLYD